MGRNLLPGKHAAQDKGSSETAHIEEKRVARGDVYEVLEAKRFGAERWGQRGCGNGASSAKPIPLEVGGEQSQVHVDENEPTPYLRKRDKVASGKTPGECAEAGANFLDIRPHLVSPVLFRATRSVGS